jgi:hypothetical protein
LWQLRQLSNWSRHSDLRLVAVRVDCPSNPGVCAYRVVFEEPAFVDQPSIITVLHTAAVAAEGIVNRLR